MYYIILILYLVVIIVFTLLTFFIAYHLSKYSFNTYFKGIAVPFFIFVSTLLLFLNVMLFFSVDWQNLIPNIISF